MRSRSGSGIGRKRKGKVRTPTLRGWVPAGVPQVCRGGAEHVGRAQGEKRRRKEKKKEGGPREGGLEGARVIGMWARG